MSRKMSRTFQLGAVLALFAMSATVVAACGDDDDSGSGDTAANGNATATISVGLAPVSPSVCLKVTDDRGLFEEEGITLEFVPPASSSTAQVAQILNGQVTAGFGAYTAVVAAVSNGLPVVMTNAMDEDFRKDGQSSIEIIVGKDTGITNFAELEGKTVGVNSLKGTWEVMTKDAIAKDGGDPSNVKLVPVSFGDQATALASGNVDAITAAQPLVGLLLEQGFESIGNPQAVMMGTDDSTAGGIFMAKSYVDENSEAVETFIDTLAEGNEYCNDPANADFMRREIAQFTELPQEIVDATPLPAFSVALSTEETERWIEVMSEYGIIENEPAPDEVQWSGAVTKEDTE